MSPIKAAKLVSQSSYQAAGKLKITEHFFEVPKDYSKPDDGTIRVFGRSARKFERPIVPEKDKDKDQLPWMCYLEGGPGVPCKPPQQYTFTHFLLDRGYQVFFMDARGTGLSTPITASTLPLQGHVDAQAEYVKLHRADSIVRDCEAIRQALTADFPDEKKKWSTIGQSFGGFCTITYLSYFPDGLRECFVFGGLAPLDNSPDDPYRRLYPRAAARNRAYYAKFPDDVARVHAIMDHLHGSGAEGIPMPSGGALTRHRFLQIGMALGMHGGLDTLHDIVFAAHHDLAACGHLTRRTLSAIEQQAFFDDNPVYALLLEPAYCSGHAPAWSADRIRPEFPAFALDAPPRPAGQPVYFVGEMMYRGAFADYAALRPLRALADRLARDPAWPLLWDSARLAANAVPVYAAAYADDMFVDFDASLDTASRIRGCKVFTTNVLFHDASSSKMDEVMKQAFALRDDVVD